MSQHFLPALEFGTNSSMLVSFIIGWFEFEARIPSSSSSFFFYLSRRRSREAVRCALCWGLFSTADAHEEAHGSQRAPSLHSHKVGDPLLCARNALKPGEAQRPALV